MVSSPGSLASLAVLCMAWMLVLTSWTNGGGSAIAEKQPLWERARKHERHGVRTTDIAAAAGGVPQRKWRYRYHQQERRLQTGESTPSPVPQLDTLSPASSGGSSSSNSPASNPTSAPNSAPTSQPAYATPPTPSPKTTRSPVSVFSETPAPAASGSSANTAEPTTAGEASTLAPSGDDDDDDDDGNGSATLATPAPDSIDDDDEAATVDESDTPAPTSTGTDEVVQADPTPAPTMEGAVAKLSGSISAPSSVLGSPASSGTLSEKLRSLLELEDQDILQVDIDALTSTRRRLVRSGFGGGMRRRNTAEYDEGAGWGGRVRGVRGTLTLDEGQHGHRDSRSMRRAQVAKGRYRSILENEPGGSGGTGGKRLAGPRRGDVFVTEQKEVEGEAQYQHRTLADDDNRRTARFEVVFVNDPGETVAYGRGTDAVSTLLNSTSSLASALNTTDDEIAITDVVFLSTTASDVDTDEAATTFVSRDTTPSGSAIGIGIAVILAAIIATGCIGLACGKCWIHQERRGRKMKYSPQPAYERPSAAPDDSADGSYSRYPEDGEIYNGAGVKGNGTKGDGSNRSNPSEMGSRSKTAFGRLAPTVSVGGLLSKPLALSDRGSGPEGAGDSRYMYDAEKGAGGGLDQGESGRSMGVRGNDGADVMLEHDYGDPGQTESFVDGVDGAYSEFGGQSEYDSVVPGGSVNDGALSDGESSSRFYDDDGQSMEWGEDGLGSQQGPGSLLAGFPVRKASSRFSAGPRSQASFATPSVAASGRSVQSSVIPSRANFPPASGGTVSPPYRVGSGRGGMSGLGGEGTVGLAGSPRLGLALGRERVEVDDVPAGTGLEKGGVAPGGEGGGGIVRAGGLDYGRGSGQEVQREEDEEGRVDRGGDSNAETTATNPGAGVSPSATAMMPPPRVPTQPGESTVGRRWPRRNNDDVDGVVEGQPGPAARRAAAAAATAAETARGRAPYGGGGDNGGGITGRPSLDSAAGSIAVSSIVHSSNKNGSSNNSNSNQYFRSPPGSSVGGAGVGAGAVGGAGIRSGDAAQDSLNSRADGGVGRGDDDDGGSKNASIPGVHDDDAASQYAGSGVGVIPVGEDGRGTSWRAGDGRAGGMALGAGGGEGRAEDRRLGARPTRFGGLTSGPSGRNSQSIGGMSAGGDDSDQESFVSRVGSFALTDIGQGTSDRGGSSGRALMHPGGGVIGAGGGAGGIFSPTSTVLRSTTGMSEAGTERDSYGSDGYTNGSDSPGAQSGWERAWMRQRDDTRHFGGGKAGGGQG